MVKEKLSALYEAEKQRIAGMCDDRGDYLNPVFGEGPEAPLVMLIGEAPGKEEAKSSRPFVGKAGKQLDTLLEKAGIDRGKVYVTNSVKYRPINKKERSVSNRTPSTAEVKAGLPLLREEIFLLEPLVIVTLGNTPLKALGMLCERKLPTIGELHGKPTEISIEGRTVTLIPQYHPASVIYNRALENVMEEDLISLGAYIRKQEESL